MERPREFDQHEVARHWATLVAGLNRAFDCACTEETGVLIRDASFYGQLVIPAASTRSDADIWRRVSNFGSLARYSLEQFGAYDSDELAVLLDNDVRNHVESALLGSGHVAVPEHLLWEPYDGQVAFLREPQSRSRTSWFHALLRLAVAPAPT